VLIYNLAGTHLATIPSPNSQFDGFDRVIRPVDDHRFLVGAHAAPVVYFNGVQFVTNTFAGAVHLYDDTGALLRTFTSPFPAQSRSFGAAIAMLGPARLLIGAPGDAVSGNDLSGRVYLFNLDGAHLETIDNPEPLDPRWTNPDDLFGSSLEVLDGRRFVIGAAKDDAWYLDSGSIYGFDYPVPEIEIGSEIPRPPGVDASGAFASQGPTVAPAGAAFWHVPSAKLFAVKPGGILVTWPMLSGPPKNWEGVQIWPTDTARYQDYVAGQAAVDLSSGGSFTHATLHGTTTDANPVTVEQAKLFSSSLPAW
jgi:hypothetical protein